MDLDYCLVCEKKCASSNVYCSQECRLKDHQNQLPPSLVEYTPSAIYSRSPISSSPSASPPFAPYDSLSSSTPSSSSSSSTPPYSRSNSLTTPMIDKKGYFDQKRDHQLSYILPLCKCNTWKCVHTERVEGGYGRTWS